VNTDDELNGSQMLAEVLLRDAERIAERSVARMQELLPAYARVPRDELIPVTLTNTRNLLEAVRDPDADHSREQPAYRASGDVRARQGITSDEMLNAWRIGLEGVREAAHEVADDLGVGNEALLEFVVATLRWGDIGMRASASAHHEAEIRELGRLAEEQTALRRVATQVAQGAPSARLFAVVAEHVARVLRVPLVSIARYEADGTASEWASRSEQGELELSPEGTRRSLDGTNVLADVRRSCRSARIDDYTGLEGPIAQTCRAAGIRSTVGVPIVVAGELWGAIAVSSPVAEPLPVETESRLVNFCDLVAVAISNANARAEVERLAEAQAALRRVATMVARERAAEEVFAKVAEEVALLLGADSAVIHRYEPDEEATVVGSWGNAIPPGSRWKMDGHSVATLVHRTQRPVRVDDFEHASGSIGGVARELGLRSAVGSPIFVNGRCWGCIAAATSRAEPMPPDAESRIAEFTELVATAISNIQARADLAASRARIVVAADEERRRVVRDLHDGAQQRLVHTILTLKLARQGIDPEQEGAALVDEAREHAETAIDELRALAHGILPSALTRGGLRVGVTALAARISIPVEIDISVNRLPRAIEATAYFIVSEALTNVAKHSRAQRATVSARLEDRALEVEVRDNGIGGARLDGSGLVGLSDRLAALDGSLRVESPARGGTRIAASIPVG
jgi:signal transduction histidine kinase